MKFVELNKMNKKQRAAYFKKQRNTWDFSPVTRTKNSKKVYKREKRFIND